MYFDTVFRHWLSLRALAVALAAFGLPAAAMAANGALQTDLSTADTASVASGEQQRVTVRLTFKNSSQQDVYILGYETPLRGFERDLFIVERDGERIPYTGIVAYRAGPSQEDWIHLAPGVEVSEVVDISGAYDTRRGGAYTVRYNTVQQVFRGVPRSRLPVGVQGPGAQGSFVGESVTSEPVTVSITATASAESAPDSFAAPDAVPDVASVAGEFAPFATYACRSPSVISTAQASARSRALRAYNAATSFNAWYRTWFGNSSAYVATVRSRFGNAVNRLGQNVDYYCGSYAYYCSGNIIAYTYKQTTNRMYLCEAFWSYGDKGHVVGHESYHWYSVAGADDVTYGYSQCQNLARTRPYDALRNSDNHAYAADYAP